MPNFRRYYVPNALIFITSVTKNRFPYFQTPEVSQLLLQTIENVHQIHPFNMIAYAVLPDHFHFIFKPEYPDGNFSKIVHSIKRNFSINYKKYKQIHNPINIWQKRFWDHVIRDENELESYINYIHWNPVKHSYVKDPSEWKFSSLVSFIQKGFYEPGWGKTQPSNIINMDFE